LSPSALPHGRRSGSHPARRNAAIDVITSIRRATASDEAAARAIVAEYNDAVGVVVRDDAATLRAYLGGPGALWLAQLGGEIVGCVVMRPLAHLDPQACEVKRLYVRSAQRGLGIAVALMDALEAFAVREGYRAIYLDTFDDLADAVRFYERRGYERVARYNDNPQATIFMRRTLAEPPR
jgi:ribosomal protein S18 acetylase RimI-like enzyme